MYSYVSIVHNRRRECLQKIGEQACRKLHETNTIIIANAVIDHIRVNVTNLRSVSLTGLASTDGRYSEAQYTDSGKTLSSKSPLELR